MGDHREGGLAKLPPGGDQLDRHWRTISTAGIGDPVSQSGVIPSAPGSQILVGRGQPD